ncbi:MAG TPA: hypothetical protein VKG44_07540, partial [Candidatus Baltobacteraceae bacterium]|nr:hypothetical protein [Candidatus Baltobacteraceae bacterium]
MSGVDTDATMTGYAAAILALGMLTGCARVTASDASLAGSWRIAVTNMDGQRGVLRVGPSGATIGLLYQKREPMLQPVFGVLGPSGGHLVLERDTSRFHDPGFVQTEGTPSSLRGTWQSGFAGTDGKLYGAGSGTWNAHKLLQVVPVAPVSLPPAVGIDVARGDRMSCLIVDAHGESKSFTPPAARVYAVADQTNGRLVVSAFDGSTKISLVFARLTGPNAEKIDLTETPSPSFGDPIALSRGSEIQAFFEHPVSSAQVRAALAGIGVRAAL